jgi:cytochrome c-type biogenesis protein CcmH
MPVLFWGLLAGMTLAALAFLLLPLWRGRRAADISRRELNIALYRERLQELERALAAGETSVEEATAARAELDARLLADVGSASGGPAAASRPGRRRALALVLATALPALALGLYLHTSDWQLALVGDGPEAVPLLLQRLERHLEEQPADAAGWRLLARTRADLRDYDQAAAAYARLNALAPTAETLVAEAEAVALRDGGNLQGRPLNLIGQALQQDPDYGRALWYAGLAARQRGDDRAALQYWNALAAQELPADVRRLLDAQIVQAGGKPPAAPAAFRIPIRVELDPRLAARVSADMPLFVYARAAGEQGGPPLAVTRRRAGELPLELVLDDSHSMLPERKLSSARGWTLTARIARQGSAETRSGDLLAEQPVTREQLREPVRLTIDRVVP